jgi:putative RecB family exonuclease
MTENEITPNGASFTVTVGNEYSEVEVDSWEPSDLPLSPSKINTFLQCPRNFYYRYIAKLPDKLTLHLFRGTIVHDILERIFEQDFKYPSRWRNGEPQEWALLEFRKLWAIKKEKMPYLFKDPNIDAEVMERETIDLLVNFCHRVEKKLHELMDWKVARSKDMALKQLKPHFREVRLNNKELKIRGIVDVVVKDFEDNISIVDYKTSKRYGSWLPDDYYRQLIIYALLYKEETGVTPKFAGIDWLRYDDCYFVAINDGVIEEARELIKGIHNEIKKRGDDVEQYEMVPQTLCKWCAFYKKPCEPKGIYSKKKK